MSHNTTQDSLPPLPVPYRIVQDADGFDVQVFRVFQMRDYAHTVAAELTEEIEHLKTQNRAVAACIIDNDKAGAVKWAVGLMATLDDEMRAERVSASWDASQIKQPGWHHVQQAFIDGAREARANPDASDDDVGRASDGYTKRVFEEVDPVSESALRTESWAGENKSGDIGINLSVTGVGMPVGTGDDATPCDINDVNGTLPHPVATGALPGVWEEGGVTTANDAEHRHMLIADRDESVTTESLFELWWAEYMPEATQARAWAAYSAALLPDDPRVQHAQARCAACDLVNGCPEYCKCQPTA